MIKLKFEKWSMGMVFYIVFSMGDCFAAIAQTPLFLTISVDPNVLFNMSVETPMGGAAYNDQPNGSSCGGRIYDGGEVGVCYLPANKYLGYFNPDKCYDYVASGWFEAVESVVDGNTNHECNGKFSGNFMNWASMTAIDMFTWTMTGGNRVIDGADTTTVIQRARKINVDSWFPRKMISAANNVSPAKVTPWADSKLFIYNTDFGIQFGTTYGGNDKGVMNLKVRVCNKLPLETNCVAYNDGAYYKPEGLIQKNADHMRFGVTSYSNTNGNDINGGVLRSNMKYVGTLMPNGSGGTITNPNSEINTDGTINLNSNTEDAAASGVTQSGVIPYINKFSEFGYKGNDPAGELFYESIRYYKNLGPTSEYLGGVNGGFPILGASQWKDPIVQYCQKNFVIGINDANPWMDKKLPGTFFTASTFNGHDISQDFGEPSTPDSDIDVTALTNKVGDLQGLTGTSQCIGCTALNCDMAASDKILTHLGEVFGTCPYPAKDNTYYIAGLAYYANISDIRASLPGKQSISTFMIDTQEYSWSPLTGQMNMLWLAGKYGGFNDANNNQKPDDKVVDSANNLVTPSEWDLDGNSEPDNYVLATNPEKLVAALTQAFNKIEEKSSSASAVAANTSRLDTGTLIYQAKFDTKGWSGELQALAVDTTNGDLNFASPVWEASAKLPAHSSRKIFSYNPVKVAGARGIAFTWDNLSKDSDVTSPHISQQTYLNTLNGIVDSYGEFRVDWLRGDSVKEDKNTGGIFRSRSNVLGDIINSDPVYAWKEDYGYGKWTNTAGTKYAEFRSSSAYLNRSPMLYVGANDGMLHGFDARKNEGSVVSGGTELFAYIPNALYPQLSKLTNPGYIHQYYVDGLSSVGDVYADLDNNGSVEWHTLLAGTTGAGGKTIFALDVTNPDSFGAGNVLWEFSNALETTVNTDPDMGNTLAQPAIGILKNGSWAVVVGNGYNSDNGKAVLFILDAKTGEVIKKIDTSPYDATPTTPTPPANGLSSPIALDTDLDVIIDTVYAGDLHGNLWKFDLSSSDPNEWRVANSSPLFVACTNNGTGCSAANRQAITGKPNVGKKGPDQTSGTMVYFGTGKYFETGDNIVGSVPQKQTFYGLWDHGESITNRNKLQEQTITYEGLAVNADNETSATNDLIRVVSKDPVCYSSSSAGCSSGSSLQQGWAFDLVKPGTLGEGERNVSFPLVRRGLVIFATLIPHPDPCKYGGKSWLMELDALTGRQSSKPAFDLFGATGGAADGKVDDKDMVKVTTGSTSEMNSASGKQLDIGIHKMPSVVEGSSVDYKYLSGSTAKIGKVINAGAASTGSRISWRQLR